MILLHSSVRIPLFLLAGISLAAAAVLLGLAAMNAYAMSLIWRGVLALVVGLISLRLARRHVAPPTPRAK